VTAGPFGDADYAAQAIAGRVVEIQVGAIAIQQVQGAPDNCLEQPVEGQLAGDVEGQLVQADSRSARRRASASAWRVASYRGRSGWPMGCLLGQADQESRSAWTIVALAYPLRAMTPITCLGQERGADHCLRLFVRVPGSGWHAVGQHVVDHLGHAALGSVTTIPSPHKTGSAIVSAA